MKDIVSMRRCAGKRVNTMRKTKIICTIGPASDSRCVLTKLIENGMNVARLNFSHGTHADHKAKIDLIKEIRGEMGAHVGIMLDTKGPEIRTGRFSKPEVELQVGQEYTLTTEDIEGDETRCSISYHGLPADVVPGNKILIDDGLIELEVRETTETEIHCVVNNAGIVKNNKGINVPGVKIHLPSLTEKDIDDIKFGVENGIDFIAASFIRKASDVKAIREVLKSCGGEGIFIISKIENKEGVDNIAEIVAESDGIMVARGDLGVEIPAEQVPIIQKNIIRRCNFEGVPVITATQMLDSMMRNPRPTRAEVADVANAILDGTDAIMLSGESASGKYPVEALKTMNNIAQTAEATLNYDLILRERALMRTHDVTNTIGHATVTSAHGLNASAIITPTSSGATAFTVAKFRPKTKILAFAATPAVARRLSLCWGTDPQLMAPVEHENQIFREVVAISKGKGFVEDGDIVVITAGLPVGGSGNTNMMRIHVVGGAI